MWVRRVQRKRKQFTYVFKNHLLINVGLQLQIYFIVDLIVDYFLDILMSRLVYKKSEMFSNVLFCLCHKKINTRGYIVSYLFGDY